MLISLSRRLRNFIRRNFSCCPASIREQCYKTLVRPQLKYASSVWDNTIKRNTTKVQAVQWSEARFSYHDYRRTTMFKNCSGTLSSSVEPVVLYICCTVSAVDWLPFLPQSISRQLWSTPEDLKPATDRSSTTQACTAKPSFPVQLDYMAIWLYASWCLPAAVGQGSTEHYSSDVTVDWPCFSCTKHCFHLLLFGFLLCITAVLTTSTAHTCTYTAVRYCSITESAPLLDEDRPA